jgi:Predicted 3'-5' exonuclease related to the exonuclease domain of PolB
VVFSSTGLRRQELRTGSKLELAIQESRQLSLDQRLQALQLLNSPRHWFNAVSPQARIRWGEMVCEEFSDHFHLGPDNPEPDQRVFLVTLCDRRCCTSHEAKNIPIARFIRILRRGLRGLSYLGMLEPGYYVNLCEGTHVHGKRLVSWHVHLLAWGESKSAIRTRIESLNKESILLPIADGLAAAHQKRISREKLADKFCYLLKSPRLPELNIRHFACSPGRQCRTISSSGTLKRSRTSEALPPPMDTTARPTMRFARQWGTSFPKHIYHSIICIGALVAHCDNGHWQVDALGAPHIGERPEKELITGFVNRIAELSPQLVTFNGSGFDLPVLRYRTMVHAIPAIGLTARPYFHRYSQDAIDLCDVLSSFSSQAKVSLHELCRVMGLPGKPNGISAADVERYHREGRIREIAEYCESENLSPGVFRLLQQNRHEREVLTRAA